MRNINILFKNNINLHFENEISLQNYKQHKLKMSDFSLDGKKNVSKFSLKRWFSFSQSEESKLPEGIIPCRQRDLLDFFQNSFGNLQRSYGSFDIFLKSSSKYDVYLGFYSELPLFLSHLWISLRFSKHWKEIFLLLMDDNLAGVMQGMSLEDDVPIVLPEDDDYSAIERTVEVSLAGCSIHHARTWPECSVLCRRFGGYTNGSVE